MSNRVFMGLVLALALASAGPARAGELRAISDVHSKVSGSNHTILELARMAASKGVDVIFLTDHTRVAMSYGLPPFRHVFRYRKERPSVQLFGPKKYFEEVRRAGSEVGKVLVVPGLKAAPYYWWQGSYFDDDLTARDYNKQIVVLGLSKPEEIKNMPVINGSPAWRSLKANLLGSAIFFVPLAVGLYLGISGGRLRWAGVAVAVISILAVLNDRPLSPIRADPYSGGPAIEPYQELIDYVDGLGGLTFWVMPTTRAFHKLGPATLLTEPHEDDLLNTRGYTGFEALYGDALKLHLAGSAWDSALAQYLRGERKSPPFAIAGSDFWRVGKSKLAFDQYQIVFFNAEKRVASLLKDLRRGRIYARRKSADDIFPRLARFELSSPGSERAAQSGETLMASGPPVVSVELVTEPARGEKFTLTVVREGSVIRKISGEAPFSLSFEDRDVSLGGPTYYRVFAKGRRGMFIVSNPIFVRFI